MPKMMEGEFWQSVTHALEVDGLHRVFCPDQLRSFRNERGMTQKQLGDAIGVVWQQIYKWESGKAKPNADTVAKLADALKLEYLDDLYCWIS